MKTNNKNNNVEMITCDFDETIQKLIQNNKKIVTKQYSTNSNSLITTDR